MASRMNSNSTEKAAPRLGRSMALLRPSGQDWRKLARDLGRRARWIREQCHLADHGLLWC